MKFFLSFSILAFCGSSYEELWENGFVEKNFSSTMHQAAKLPEWEKSKCAYSHSFNDSLTHSLFFSLLISVNLFCGNARYVFTGVTKRKRERKQKVVNVEGNKHCHRSVTLIAREFFKISVSLPLWLFTIVNQ